ncbi:MAG: prepilin-type N-terminal cleavage/methylation domain-containing protein [Candidatus Omnitrophica bacterium]|nr:prepilin-type N-terminal cleavage/methylation domain-containing protein [Candidatus Omnitrophota bacterium]MCM8825517.1 prepilin-type N-terminal cleavage/methylation domain-containing protein [Candidatus Omnitrophota bacterium]
MKKNRLKSGFTLLELLVALALLVIIVGLSAYLYARAARLRKLITYQNEVQNTLNSMITEISYGSRNTIGLEFAHNIKNDPQNAFYELAFYDRTKGETVFYLISPGMNSEITTDTTLWQAKSNSAGTPARNSGLWKLIDANKSIVLDSGSGFTYYGQTNSGLHEINSEVLPDTCVAVKITLKGKTTDPSLKTRPVITTTILARIKNKLPF